MSFFLGILEVVFCVVILVAMFQLFIKIISSPWGFVLFMYVPCVLFLIRLNYLWDMFSATEDIFLPNPLSPSGFLYDVFADIVGRNLDRLFGIDFFADAFAWLLGAIDYVVLLTAVHYLFYYFYLSRLANHYRWCWLAAVLFVVWLIVFHHLFYNRGFKDWGLDPLARPDEMTKYCPYFTSYYWLAMAFSAIYVVADIKRRVF